MGGTTRRRLEGRSPARRRRSEYLSSVPWGTGASPQFRLVLAVVLDWLPNRYNCKNSTEVVTFFLLRPETHKAEERLHPCPTRESAVRVALDLRRLLDDGVVRNQAEIARLRGISGSRVTQLVKIASLPRPILDYLLSLSAEQQVFYTERRLRRIVRLDSEEEQLRAFEDLRRSVEASGK